MDLGIIGTVLGVAIGFVLVMLLLSFLVTGLSQGAQALLRLRGRATRATLVRSVGERRANEVLPLEWGRFVVPFDHVKWWTLPAWLIGACVVWLRGPGDRMVYRSQLIALGLNDDEQKQFDAQVTDRFTRWMRWLTLASAAVVAFSFQVSTPQLLKELSTDKNLRLRALEIADRIEHERRSVQPSAADFRSINEHVLEEIGAKNHDLQLRLEEVSGQASDVEDAETELGLILADHPRRAQVLMEYGNLIRAKVQAGTRASAELRSMGDDLALLNITFWGRSNFFRGETQISNIVGVVLTVIFLTFGAPFWYERLRDLQVLRDSLYSRAGEERATETKRRERSEQDRMETW